VKGYVLWTQVVIYGGPRVGEIIWHITICL
jgi:hypothetical protein